MKILPKSISFVLLLISKTIFAQIPSFTTYITLKDSIVSKYNSNDYKAIYAMAADNFKSKQSEQTFINFLNQIKPAGQILSSDLVEDFGEIKYFKLKMEKATLQFTLRAKTNSSFAVFGLTNYVETNTETLNELLSDNPLKNSFDSSIDRSIKRYFANPNTAGLSISLIKNGQVYSYNYGEIKKGTRIIPTKHTIYEIGSVGKTFTGIILAQAVIDSKVNLDDDIRNFLDGNYPNLEYEMHPIKIVNLSNHTSGIPDIPDNFEHQKPYDSLNPYSHYTMSMFWDALHKTKLDTLPGEVSAYSNMEVALLGHILQKVYKMSYYKMVKKFILRHSQMNDTKIFIPYVDKKRFAQGYGENGNPVPHWDVANFAAAGALRSTTADMIKYVQLNIAENTKAVKYSHKPTSEDTGLLWGINKTVSGFTAFNHGGGTGGFSSFIKIIPELKVGFIILANSNIDISNLTREIMFITTKK